ncbi:hypothetical protein [Arthrobacter sp. ISL-95]|uniref:hypothetical protein n=1 Tax=Arthrobacter sp. ISL-95 TaxID=2819116 RepID=UPI001BE5C072|nr:hypothetical protein [Arthrobacter sp. ISL-95]MBT2585170.1 hypothetical protein [Arthrobacter sp. ISL-95]
MPSSSAGTTTAPGGGIDDLEVLIEGRLGGFLQGERGDAAELINGLAGERGIAKDSAQRVHNARRAVGDGGNGIGECVEVSKAYAGHRIGRGTHHGHRERDYRKGFTAPPSIKPKTVVEGMLHPAWALGFLANDAIAFPNLDAEVPEGPLASSPDMWRTLLAGSTNPLTGTISAICGSVGTVRPS